MNIRANLSHVLQFLLMSTCTLLQTLSRPAIVYTRGIAVHNQLGRTFLTLLLLLSHVSQQLQVIQTLTNKNGWMRDEDKFVPKWSWFRGQLMQHSAYQLVLCKRLDTSNLLHLCLLSEPFCFPYCTYLSDRQSNLPSHALIIILVRNTWITFVYWEHPVGSNDPTVI